MSSFEDDLWAVLAREHGADAVEGGQVLAPEDGQRRRLKIGAGLLVLALATAVVVALMSAGGGPQAAYAVTRNPDGTVTLTLEELVGVQPANEELARLGVRLVVRRIEADCHETGRIVRPEGGGDMQRVVETSRLGDGLQNLRWTIHPSAIPAGDTVGLTVEIAPHSRIPAVGMALALFEGPASGCSRAPLFSR